MADSHSNPLLALFRSIRSWFGASGAPGLLRRLGALALVAMLVGWQTGWAPVLAQTITGTLGAPMPPPRSAATSCRPQRHPLAV